MNVLSLSTDVLAWAAEQVGETYEVLVNGLAARPKDRERLLEGRLTIAQAQKVSATTGIPYGLLFLPVRPAALTRPALPDLRQTPDARLRHVLSREFQEAYEDALRKQQWYATYLAEEGAGPLPFVGKFTEDASAEAVARDIGYSLGMSSDLRAGAKTPEDYFRVLAARTEDLGVLVMKSGIVKSNTHRPLSVEEFRGFAVADKFAPLVFINGRDAEVAAVFTLIHELAHIWVGVSGVSDLTVATQDHGGVERLCNQVAAEALVPKHEFFERWGGLEQLAATARHFRVSNLVIARRALGFQQITKAEYLQVAARPVKKSAEKSGGDPYATIPVRNSKLFTTTLVGSVMSGGTLIREAASLLNVRPDTVMELGRRRGDASA